jgi:hypothetical protein
VAVADREAAVGQHLRGPPSERVSPNPPMAFLKITKIDTHVLLVPDVNPEAMSSSQDEFRKLSFVASTIRVCWAHS